jgi:hypothetical protein
VALRFYLAHAAFDLFNIGAHDDLIARMDGVTEAQLVDARKIRNQAAVFFRIEQRDAADLGHGFRQQHARHNRLAREVALEKQFVERRVLNADSVFHRFQLDDAVYEQHRIAMRQNFHNIRYFQNHMNSSLI